MNIFILDENIHRCAAYHNDKHCVKMIVESCQMLANAYSFRQLFLAPRTQSGATRSNTSHLNHPCSKWVLQSADNWKYLQTLTLALLNEYNWRYNKTHFCTRFVLWTLQNPADLPSNGRTPFAQAMPAEYKSNSAVDSYRQYYIMEKQHIAVWSKRPIPFWWREF